MSQPYGVLIGGSAGSLQPIKTIVQGLPSGLSGSFFIAVHIDPQAQPLLVEILQKDSKIPLRYPNDEEYYLPSTIYVAPPGHHMLLTYRKVWIFPANFVYMPKPNIDLMLQSAANEFMKNSIAVILSGYGTDGSVGVKAIKEKGGTVIVQQPDTAEQPSMPKAAIATGVVDYIIPPEVIPGAIDRIIKGNVEDRKMEEIKIQQSMK